MPQMGESIVEGTLTKWLKKPGENVERDEPLFEISTDKVDTEIPSPAAGTSGRDSGAGRDDGRHQHRGGTDQRWRGAPAAAPAPARGRCSRSCTCPQLPHRTRCGPSGRSPCGRRSPLRSPKKPPDRFRRWCARWRARTISILSQVRGTGAGGRITKQDLEAYLEARTASPSPARSSASRRSAASPAASQPWRRNSSRFMLQPPPPPPAAAGRRASPGASPFPWRSRSAACASSP